MKVAVLGGGIAGLLAAKAVQDVVGDAPLIINDRPLRTVTWGTQHGIHVLHDSCGIDTPEMLVTNLVVLPTLEEPSLMVSLSDWERKMANGTYGQKVYGSRKATTSLVRMPGVIEGYEFVTAYNILVKRFSSSVEVHRPVNEHAMHKLCREYDLVVSSIPRHAITPKWVKHPFAVAYISQSPPIGFEPKKYMGQNFVVYNADPAVQWSRTSRVHHGAWDFWSTEYNSIPPYAVPDLKQVEKVVACEPFGLPENLLTVGRLGEWMPGVLAHDAYWKTVEEMRRRA